MPIRAPKVLISENIQNGKDAISATITIFYTGNINFEITADADAVTPTWDNVTLISGVSNKNVFTVAGNNIRYRIIGSIGATIFKSGSKPAIRIQMNFT